MNIPTPDKFQSDTNRAVADRLARLGTMPVDTTRLERMIGTQIPRPATPSARATPRLRWLRPLQALAASLLVTAVVGALIWSATGGPVMASTAQMAQMHRDLVAERVPVTKVDSIEEASRILAGQQPDQPGLPAVPNAHLMACCMTSIKDRQVACVLFRNDGQPVTMSVARASDVRSPPSPTTTRDGVSYHVETTDTLTMVTTQRDGRWICLIGELPADRLIEIAHGLQFPQDE
ncbi:MAG: hypothetical protein WD042_05295 [Phycisphaeraceae bacterium]